MEHLFSLAIFQVLNSHLWILATTWDSEDLWKSPIVSENFID